MTAKLFIDKLKSYQSDIEIPKVAKYFKGNDGVTKVMGVRFGNVYRAWVFVKLFNSD